MKKRRLVALVCTMALLSTMFGCASGKKEDGKKETISESRDESSSEIETTVNNDGTTSRDENSSQSTSDKETESVSKETETTTKKEELTTTKKPEQQTTTKKPVQETTTKKPTQETTTKKPTQETTKNIVKVSGVTLKQTNITLNKGEEVRLVATVSPAQATDKSVSWTSSDPSVATVDYYGYVTAKKCGTTTIKVETTSGSKVATCTVTVKPQYASVNSLSEKEKELLPYYDNGWTRLKNGSNIDIYYLGKKATSVPTKLKWIGTEYKLVTAGKYDKAVITDDHKLFIVADDNSYYGNYFIFIYDLDKDEYIQIYSSLKKSYEVTYGSFESFITDGKNVYMLMQGNYSKMNVLKYNEMYNEFEYVNSFSINMNELLVDNFVYYKSEDVWKTESYGYVSSSSHYEHALVTLDIKNGKIEVDEENLGQGIAAGTKFSMYQREKGIKYYWKDYIETNEYTGSSKFYKELRRYDEKTNTDKYYYRVARGYEGDLEFIGVHGVVVTYNGYNDFGMVYNEDTDTYVTCKDIIGYDYEDAYDMWNYYYNGKAYSLWN